MLKNILKFASLGEIVSVKNIRFNIRYNTTYNTKHLYMLFKKKLKKSEKK
jgi:hypothetical protein